MAATTARKGWPGLALLLTLFLLANPVAPKARADIVRHFDPPGTVPGHFPFIDLLLNNVGIGATNSASERTVTTFVVPGHGAVDLTFRAHVDGGIYNYEFGFYDVSRVTANPITDRRNFAVQALSAAVSVFDDRLVDPGAARTVRVQGGQTLGFFIVPDNTISGFLANPDAFYPPTYFLWPDPRSVYNAPLFSLSDANPGEFDQMLSFVGNGVTLFAFEDVARAGPNSGPSITYIDLGFSIDVALQSPGVPEPTSALLLGAGLLVAGVYSRRRRTESKGRFEKGVVPPPPQRME